MLKLDMPEDLKAFVLKVQGEVKSKKCLGKYSQQKTILHIIKEYKELREKPKK
jgi:hypothetical protein